jgi:transcription termination factor NusB
MGSSTQDYLEDKEETKEELEEFENKIFETAKRERQEITGFINQQLKDLCLHDLKQIPRLIVGLKDIKGFNRLLNSIGDV